MCCVRDMHCPAHAASCWVQVQRQNEQQADTLTALASGAEQQQAQLQDFQTLLEAMQGECCGSSIAPLRWALPLPGQVPLSYLVMMISHAEIC